MEPERDNEMLGIRFTPEVTLGHVIQALIAAAGVASVIFVFAGRINETSSQFQDFKTTVLLKIDDLQKSTGRQIDSVNINIANLPDMRATIAQMDRRLEQDEKRLDQADSRAGAQSDRMLHIESIATDAENRLNMLMRTPTRNTAQ